MAKTQSFNIKDKELAEALSINLERLYEICDFFDSNDEDEWDLNYEEHFIWVNQKLKKRIFSPQGAYAICKYIDQNEGKNLLRKLQRWVTGRDRRIRSMLVQKKIIDIVDEKNAVIFQSGKAFITQRYTREILGLGRRQDTLNKAFDAEMKTPNREPLQLDKHFIIDEKDHKCFSGVGIARVSSNLGQTLTNRHRREWCNLVSQQIGGEIKRLMEDREQRDKKIKSAMQKAKNSARGVCQITGERKTAANPFNLAVHHVFDKKTYPNLADHHNNLIVIKDEIHQEFHAWMGGTKEPCDVEDLEKFIIEFSNDLFMKHGASQMSKTLKKIKKIKLTIKPLL
ncbi:hypothetical protein [Picosynechococcus sp. PCC 73109]|uniref:hypothetical protein n=1 Tax=Picosynechococcus sp. PCC 73109 TaxID=374982 RepID=UPI00074580B3|nr:hypothetical protein [Picosynechococcus sp. PCC 73109]AMA09894.1 hypothetical protein AWQ23_11520 [Picosynechococcus sp. PCC 73109]